jgi:GNAT superfamily N-acetyltransferase
MSSDYAALVAAEQVWVAMVEGEPAGLVVLQPKTDHMFLENLAVHPDQQGRGIGSWLLAFAEDRARGLGLPELRLYTNEAMVENLAYYSRRGYREDRRATEDGFHRVFFVKRLVEPAAADRQG